MEDWKKAIKHLKTEKDKRDISGYKIAQVTGLSQATIGRFFAVNNPPTLPTFFLIARALDQDVQLQGKGVVANSQAE